MRRRSGPLPPTVVDAGRSEEHTSELQSQSNLVCRLLPEKKVIHLSGASGLDALARAVGNGARPLSLPPSEEITGVKLAIVRAAIRAPSVTAITAAVGAVS